jgi:putative oxidoreductase
MSALVNLGNRILNVAPSFSWLPPLLARVMVGWTFTLSGWGKLNNLDRVEGFFGSIGIPSPGFMAPFVGTIELVGGILLIVGLGTRLACIPLIIVMIVALSTAVADQVDSLVSLFALRETLYIGFMIWLMVAGPGRVALDKLVARKYRG